jgi:hypothetical protein
LKIKQNHDYNHGDQVDERQEAKATTEKHPALPFNIADLP